MSPHPDPAETHLTRLTALLPLSGLEVADIGCGGGEMVRAMAQAGASVTGLEIDPARVAALNAEASIDGESYATGRGESLPFDDASLDLVCFFFSLHHVPVPQLGAAVAEARRVLRLGGRLHIVDPSIEGEVTEALLPVEDETPQRLAAQALASDLDAHGFVLSARDSYDIVRSFAGLEQFIAGLIRVAPARAARLTEARDDVAARFARLGEETGAGRVLRQPCLLFHAGKA